MAEAVQERDDHAYTTWLCGIQTQGLWDDEDSSVDGSIVWLELLNARLHFQYSSLLHT